MIRVVNSKKLEMSDDEWNMYQEIVKSYTTITNKGSDLFQDLFDTNDKGIITFLKPPSKRQTTMEVFLFLMSVCQHQHIRLMYEEVNNITAQMNEKLKQLDIKLAALDEKLK